MHCSFLRCLTVNAATGLVVPEAAGASEFGGARGVHDGLNSSEQRPTQCLPASGGID